MLESVRWHYIGWFDTAKRHRCMVHILRTFTSRFAQTYVRTAKTLISLPASLLHNRYKLSVSTSWVYWVTAGKRVPSFIASSINNQARSRASLKLRFILYGEGRIYNSTCYDLTHLFCVPCEQFYTRYGRITIPSELVLKRYIFIYKKYCHSVCIFRLILETGGLILARLSLADKLQL